MTHTLPLFETTPSRFEIVEMQPDGVFVRASRWFLIDVDEMRMVAPFPTRAMAEQHAAALSGSD